MESSFDAIAGYIDRAEQRRDEISSIIEQINAAQALKSPGLGGRPSQPNGPNHSQGGKGTPGMGNAVMPIKGVGFTAGSAGDFGPRINPVSGEASTHTGYDFSAPAGTKIRAAVGGRVVSVKHDPIYGWETIIKTKNGYTTQYAHQIRKPRMTTPGERIHAGEVIGRVGSTGWATGPHLHFGVQRNGKWINPVKFLDRLLGRN